MTRKKALASAKMTIEMLTYQEKFQPDDFDEMKADMMNTLKAFLETDRKYEALKLSNSIIKGDKAE